MKKSLPHIGLHGLSLCLLSAAMLFVAPAGFARDEPEEGFYDRGTEGWFWYEPEPVEEEEPEVETPPPVVIATTPEPPPEIPAEPLATAGPAFFSAAWFRENLPKYKDAAWDNPTVENVRAYMYLQRYAMDRSEEFANTTEMAVVGDPFLDEITRRPSATFGTQKMDSEAGAARSNLLKKVASRAGIFFFFKSDCQYCEAQAPLVKMLQESQSFSVIPISVDGVPIPNNPFASTTRVDSGHAQKLGIVSYPALFLASPDGKFESIGQGMMSITEMGNRILIASKRNGWVTDEEYNNTRPIVNSDNNLADRLSNKFFTDDLEQMAKDQQSETNFVPPDQLMNYIRQKLEMPSNE